MRTKRRLAIDDRGVDRPAAVGTLAQSADLDGVSALTFRRRVQGPPIDGVAGTAGSPPLSTAAFAKLVGMSASFIRKEILAGQIHAVRVGRGRKCVFRITWTEVQRYRRQLGLI